MNKVILIGRLTRDPEMRTTTTGNATASFTIAVSRPFTNQQGEREADFINCVVWRKQAENVSKYCSKGSQIAVEGRLQTRSYDANDGTKRYVTEVIADNVTFLGSRAGAGQSTNDNTTSSYNSNYQSNQNVMGGASNDIVTTDLDMDPYAAMGNEISLTDDDLPF